MIRLFIDGEPADIDQTTSVSIWLGIASITRIETARTGYSKTVRIPMTDRNRRLVGDAAEIHGADHFNQQPHTARIEADGFTVIEGSPMMTRCEREASGGGWYLINIIGPGKEWVRRAAAEMFNEIPVPFDETITPALVAQSWTWEQPVRFFPVQRDAFRNYSGTVAGGVRMMTFTDYHPFLNARTLMDAIAAQGGYTIRSDFMDGEFFRSLYVSGNYPEREVGSYREQMGFLAGCFAERTATADRFGRVYGDPFTTLSSVGNIVDTADPDELRDGAAVPGVYNRNNCFRTVGSRIAYYPVEATAVGFEYALSYRSDYRIATREELRCFDRVWLDDDVERRYRVPNRNKDRRGEYRSGWQYRLIVFGHETGNGYRLTHERIDNAAADPDNLQPGDCTTVTVATFTERSVLVGTQSGERIVHPRLWILSGGSYQTYDGDWALYDGYVAETGQIDIALTVRSAARDATPASPRYFDRFHLGGAEQGMALTLSRKVTLRPVFMPHPCEGNRVRFADVAAHRVRQSEFVNALKQMFNLYFYSDALTGTLYIEPRETFYRNDVVVDWSDRIDRDRPVSIEELGSDLPQRFTLRYREGDGSTARWDESKKEILGRWSAPILNRFAKEGEYNYMNPMFTPTLNVEGSYPDAPDASLAQAGDRERGDYSADIENLNFPAKIVRYAGVEPLGEGQRWGWPSYGTGYPRIAFHDPGAQQPFTLCFEDRDSAGGLHRYYDKNLRLYNEGRRIGLYLKLGPQDIEPLISPNGLCRDFRALYRLRVAGETVLCRLEEIRDYNPGSDRSTLCIFLKHI